MELEKLFEKLMKRSLKKELHGGWESKLTPLERESLEVARSRVVNLEETYSSQPDPAVFQELIQKHRELRLLILSVKKAVSDCLLKVGSDIFVVILIMER